jgi:hypothetical protein
MDHLAMQMTKIVHAKNKVTYAKMTQLFKDSGFMNSKLTNDFD